MAFTEKNMRHNGRTIVWVRDENGVSFLACNKLRRYYTAPVDQFGNLFEYEWERPGNFPEYTDEYTASRTTGEIIVAKRIHSKVVPSEAFCDAMWEYERTIEKWCELSMALYGTCDNNSPMWGTIEKILYEQVELACKYQLSVEDYCVIFYDCENRIAHGLKPLEV